MNELTEKRTPELIGAEIRMYVDTGRRMLTLCGIEIGRRLVEAKEMLEHGEWLPWLERETEFSERTAQNYMRVFREYGAAQGSLFGAEINTKTFADLPISKALALLSVPESDRIEFAEEVDAKSISVRELEQKIKERENQLEVAEQKLKAALQDNEGNEKALNDARARIRELAALNEELEKRPVEVAVETVRDEEAIREAAAAAKAEAEKQNERAQEGLKKQLADAEKKLAAAEKERDKLKQSADSAGADAEKKAEEANKEVERLQAELEEAKKQLKASDSDVTRFGVYFSQVQNDFLKMSESLQKITEMNPETGKKLKTGAVTLLRNLLERLNPDVEAEE